MGEKCTRFCGDVSGTIWFVGWLFAIGFVKLTFWQAVLGLLLWPWYVGNALAAV